MSLSSPPSGKNMIIFRNIWAIFARKHGKFTSQRLESKFGRSYLILTIPDQLPVENFGSNIFQFAAVDLKGHFRKSLA